MRHNALFRYIPGDALPFGVTRVPDGVQFVISVPEGHKCVFKLYRHQQRIPAFQFELDREYRRGNVYFIRITGCPGANDGRSVADVLSREYEYTYEIDGKEIVDPYAARVSGRERWGKRSANHIGLRGGIALEDFDWQGDRQLGTPFSDLILYQLHVRGFTKHTSSKVKAKGTFAGIEEKIPYLKKLGINALLLLPCYEFDEIMPMPGVQYAMPAVVQKGTADTKDKALAEPGALEKDIIQERAVVGDSGMDSAQKRVSAEDAKKDSNQKRTSAESTKEHSNQKKISVKSTKEHSNQKKISVKSAKKDLSQKKTSAESAKWDSNRKRMPARAARVSEGAVKVIAGDVVSAKRKAAVSSEQGISRKSEPVRLNYWGYGTRHTYYFAPKASYASKPTEVCAEFKQMVRSLHLAGIEVLLDIYFVPGLNICKMQDCLRHWVMDYHVDGFHINQDVMPSFLLVSDPVLSGVKILGEYWDPEMLKKTGKEAAGHMLAEYNQGFMNCGRRYLKSDEGQVESFASYFQKNSSEVAEVNFMTNVNGFTMMDLVSYDVKHNEANGEMNRDGTQYNYSWNCGVEGRSRKRAILERRGCQIRNAFAMLLLAQGSPMILAGDEFGNSQNGNNNPYCQDNSVTWLNWNLLDTHREIYDYVRQLISFRKEHPVLHQARRLDMYDTLSCGVPDVSNHGTLAWRADFSYYSRLLAVLLYGDYQKKEDGGTDDSIYVIFNMYWEPKSFDLPNLPGDKEWYAAIETYANIFSEVPRIVRKKRRKRKPSLENRKKTIVPPRSVVVFVGR